jgi:hypothetical protein
LPGPQRTAGGDGSTRRSPGGQKASSVHHGVFPSLEFPLRESVSDGRSHREGR